MPKFISVPAVIEEDLVLPLRGADGVEREYVIKAATADTYLTLSVLKLQSAGEKIGPKDLGRIQAISDIESAWALTLGEDNVRAIIADGVSAADLKRATATAFYWHTSDGDESLAERAWSGKASADLPNSTTRSEEAGAAEDSTSQPASTSGTTTRPTTRRRKAEPASDGPTSGNDST